MFVPVELKVGEEAIGILPGITKQFGVDHVKAIKGEVTKIESINGEKTVTIDHIDFTVRPPVKRITKIYEYRVVKFTFGGVLQPNPQFDLGRIEKEEKCKLDPSFLHWV